MNVVLHRDGGGAPRWFLPQWSIRPPFMRFSYIVHLLSAAKILVGILRDFPVLGCRHLRRDQNVYGSDDLM